MEGEWEAGDKPVPWESLAALCRPGAPLSSPLRKSAAAAAAKPISDVPIAADDLSESAAPHRRRFVAAPPLLLRMIRRISRNTDCAASAKPQNWAQIELVHRRCAVIDRSTAVGH